MPERTLPVEERLLTPVVMLEARALADWYLAAPESIIDRSTALTQHTMELLGEILELDPSQVTIEQVNVINGVLSLDVYDDEAGSDYTLQFSISMEAVTVDGTEVWSTISVDDHDRGRNNPAASGDYLCRCVASGDLFIARYAVETNDWWNGGQVIIFGSREGDMWAHIKAS